jgi:hypothetical protein
MVETQPAAASLLGVAVAEVRRAKLAGCDAFHLGGRIDVDNLAAWLKRHPRPKLASKVKRGEKAPQDMGAASALRRLEVEERKAYRKLQEAIGTHEEPEARDWWLRCSEQLRKHDLAVEASRREAGDLVPRSEAERVIEGFTATLGLHWLGTLESLCPKLAECASAPAVLAVIEPAVGAAIAEALNSIRSRPWKGKLFPEWVRAAMQRATGAHCQ